MDYIAVYDGEEPDTGSSQIKISVDKVQKLGVRSEPAAMRSLDKVVRAVGRIEVDERRVFAIAPKFEGWVERLFVNATGQPVSKGQPLFEVYSPELVSAQREYAIATEAVKALKDAGDDPQAGMKRLADSSLARLKNWDISEEQVRALAQSGEARRTLTFRSPVSGIVMEKKAVQGMRFMPGDSLYQIADLSSVWVMADVYEQDIGSDQDRQQGQGQHRRVSRSEVRGHDHLRLSDAEARDPNRFGAAGNRQSTPVAEAGDVRGGRVAGRRQGEGVDRTEFRRHRQRHAPHRPGSARRRPLRAARGEAGKPHRQLRRGDGRRQGRRTGRGGRQFPDRRREQSQGRDRGFGAPGQSGASGAAGTSAPSAPAATPARPRARAPPARSNRRLRAKPPVVGHRAEGTVKTIDAKSGIAVGRARTGRIAQVARDDDGLQGRQQCASRRPETGEPRLPSSSSNGRRASG